MAELKRLFSHGRMNKDLDERLVPNGEYRDALNIQVDTSEGGEVGTISNVLGNTLLNNASLNASTGVFTEYDSRTWDIVNGVCIGSIRHDPTECIYWFIVGDNGSYIAEYNSTTNVVSPVLVDKNNVLNFSVNNLITGINIIDGLLFWTDNNSEPKRINIERFRNACASTAGASFTTHTQIAFQTGQTARDFILHDVTVIKASPKEAPSLNMISSLRTGLIETTTTFNFTEEVDSDGTIGPMQPTATIDLTFDQAPNYLAGDTLILTYQNTDEDEDDITVRVKVTSVPSVTPALTFAVTIDSISAQVVSSYLNWTVKLEEENPMFEFKFPRFATRWKYLDGEYSTFSPFTRVAFLPVEKEEFEYNCRQGYNLLMTNSIRQLTIESFIPPDMPKDVVEVDILYKESNNQNVYTVETFKHADSDWNNNSYTLTSEIIHALLPSNQILRHYDNVPRKALAQEVTANRLVYGNYLHQYNLTDAKGDEIKPSFDITIVQNPGMPVLKTSSAGMTTATAGAKPDPNLSVKSMRTYQLGVVYSDEFGRKTPVLTTESASQYLSKEWSDNHNIITTKIKNQPPSWATHYQFYIKEPSNEYYNLALDRIYEAEDGNVWLSFPSSERNKVDLETFLELKKEHDNSTTVENEARFKIIAIENEAPEFLKRTKKNLGSIQSEFTSEGFPLIQKTFIEVPLTSSGGYDGWDGSPFYSSNLGGVHEKSNLFAQVYTGTQSTGYVEVTNVAILSDRARINFPFPSDDRFAFTSTDGSWAGRTSPSFYLRIAEEVVENKPEFEGRFFVKVYRNSIIDTHLMKMHELKTSEYITISTKSAFYIRETDGATAGDKDFWKNFNKGRSRGTSTEWFIDQVKIQETTDNGDDWYQYAATGGDSNLVGGNNSNSVAAYGAGDVAGKESYLVLTFHHFGDGDINWDWIDGHYAQYDNFPATNEPDHQLFASSIRAPGTKMRFREDPNQHVYTIEQTYVHYLALDKKTQRKKIGSEPYMRAVRHVIKFTEDIGGAGTGGYKPIHGPNPTTNSTGTGYNIDPSMYSRGSGSEIGIEIVEVFDEDHSEKFSSTNPAIFETEPKEDIGLDLYYAAGDMNPIIVKGLVISGHSSIPTGTTVSSNFNIDLKPHAIIMSANTTGTIPANTPITLTSATGSYSFIVNTATTAVGSGTNQLLINPNYTPAGAVGTFSSGVQTNPANEINIHGAQNMVEWWNCFSFGNGVESNRIRDDFNAVQIDKGPIVSTVLAEQYKEERRGSGMIFSQIFNSTSGINRLNQFIQAETITKDLNPYYGTIQKFNTRDTDITVCCEDKILRVLSNKDALFNADGNMNITSNTSVLGQAIPYVGEYGISTNPESFASYGFRAYFSDKNRGVVLRLSRDGLTEISGTGMADYFKDSLAAATTVIGNYDDYHNSYNITLNGETIVFKESVTGWQSKMSFLPESGVSLNNIYYTFQDAQIYAHNNTNRNTFYGAAAPASSTVKFIFNDEPSRIKNFKTLSYEGDTDWIAPSIETGQQSGRIMSWEDAITAATGTAHHDRGVKEGIYYNWIKGLTTTWDNTTQAGTLDTMEFSVQGIDLLQSFTTEDFDQDFTLTIAENND